MGQGTAHLTQEILLAGGPRPVTPLLLVSEMPWVAQWAAEYGSPHLLNPPLLCSASEELSALLLSQEKSCLQTSWPGWGQSFCLAKPRGQRGFPSLGCQASMLHISSSPHNGEACLW